MTLATLRPITLADVELYRSYDGDLDGYVRSGRPGDVPDATWYAIDALRMRLALVARGVASPGFERELDADVETWAGDDDTRGALRALAIAAT